MKKRTTEIQSKESISQISGQESLSQSKIWFEHLAGWLYAFWKFSRPHTIIGTSLSVLGLYLIAYATVTGNSIPSLLPTPVRAGLLDIFGSKQPWLYPPLLPVLGAWIACLCGNVYIVGLNQLEDVAIDQINKPHLPLAAGEFSRRTGQIIVAVTGILALLLAWLLGPFLLGMVSISLAIGTAYSLPPIRLKRFPFWAALCIFGAGCDCQFRAVFAFQWGIARKQRDSAVGLGADAIYFGVYVGDRYL